MSYTLNLPTKSLKLEDDGYEVSRISNYDKSCDLAIVLSNYSPKKLIPVHEELVRQNIPYFSNMMRSDSNWTEGKAEFSNKWHGIRIVEIEYMFSRPEVFIDYLKSFYHESLTLRKDNIIEMYKIADFFGDPNLVTIINDAFVGRSELRTLDNITEFIKFKYESSKEYETLVTLLASTMINILKRKDIDKIDSLEDLEMIIDNKIQVKVRSCFDGLLQSRYDLDDKLITNFSSSWADSDSLTVVAAGDNREILITLQKDVEDKKKVIATPVRFKFEGDSEYWPILGEGRIFELFRQNGKWSFKLPSLDLYLRDNEDKNHDADFASVKDEWEEFELFVASNKRKEATSKNFLSLCDTVMEKAGVDLYSKIYNTLMRAWMTSATYVTDEFRQIFRHSTQIVDHLKDKCEIRQ